MKCVSHRVPIFRRLPQPRPARLEFRPTASYWADTATWAYCVHCRRKVGVLGQDGRWNEDVERPAHKLCAFKANRDKTWWLANGNDMLSLWSWLRRGVKDRWQPLDEKVKQRIVDALRVAMRDGRGMGPVYAAKILYLISQGLFNERCAVRLRTVIPRMCDHYQSVTRACGGDPGAKPAGTGVERDGCGPGRGDPGVSITTEA